MSTRCTVSIFNAPCLIEVHYVDMRRPLSEWYPSWRHQCNLPIWGEQMPIRNEKRCIARAHVHTPLLYLGNGWTDCADIWHVASDQLVRWLQHAHRGVTMHVSTCTPRFYILGTAELIVLKFVTWVETDMTCGFDKAIGASVHVRTCTLHLFF